MWCLYCWNPLPLTSRHVVYHAECRLCQQAYDGVTTRPFICRAKEHNASIRHQNTKSALSEHLMGNLDKGLEPCQNPIQNIKGFAWSIIDRGSSYKDSFIREGLWINKNKPTLNRTKSGWVIWLSSHPPAICPVTFLSLIFGVWPPSSSLCTTVLLQPHSPLFHCPAHVIFSLLMFTQRSPDFPIWSDCLLP